MNKLIILAALGAAAMSVAAEAAVMTITYTGTVYDGRDTTNFFGLGTNLAAPIPDPGFTLQFVIDTDIVPASNSSTPHYQARTGYGQFGNNPLVQSSFTLNGQTVIWSDSPADGRNDSYGYAERYAEYNGDGSVIYNKLQNSSYDSKSNVNSSDYAVAAVYSYVNTLVTTTDFSSQLDYHLQAGDGQFGSFQSTRFEAGPNFTRDVYAALRIDHVTVAPFVAPAVPEPATWAMMIAGFGLVGGTMRRRAKAAASYA